jgi:hypothetical protein
MLIVELSHKRMVLNIERPCDFKQADDQFYSRGYQANE